MNNIIKTFKINPKDLKIFIKYCHSMNYIFPELIHNKYDLYMLYEDLSIYPSVYHAEYIIWNKEYDNKKHIGKIYEENFEIMFNKVDFIDFSNLIRLSKLKKL